MLGIILSKKKNLIMIVINKLCTIYVNKIIQIKYNFKIIVTNKIQSINLYKKGGWGIILD